MLLVFVLILKYLLIFVTILIILLIILSTLMKIWFGFTKGVCKSTAKLHGKVALVTGGNSGIGLETARDLANRGAKVIIASRDMKRSEEAVADIISSTGNHNVEHRYLDLSNFTNVKKFVQDFNKRYERLDILVNNAGCAGLKEKLTEDGINMVMQINYFGPFLLTNLLLDKLIASKPSRIVNVSSYAHHLAKFNIEDIRGIDKLHYITKYANAKLCNILWTKALAKKLPPGVTANSLHPGLVKTDIFKRWPPLTKKIILAMISFIFKSAKEGAQTTIHLCVAEELENVSGGYYSECKPCDVSEFAKDDDLVNEVWCKTVLMTK